MYPYYPPPPRPLKKPLSGLGWALIAVSLVASGWLGMQYLIAVSEWEHCGAARNTALAAPFTEGRPDALQCLALLLNK